MDAAAVLRLSAELAILVLVSDAAVESSSEEESAMSSLSPPFHGRGVAYYLPLTSFGYVWYIAKITGF